MPASLQAPTSVAAVSAVSHPFACLPPGEFVRLCLVGLGTKGGPGPKPWAPSPLRTRAPGPVTLIDFVSRNDTYFPSPGHPKLAQDGLRVGPDTLRQTWLLAPLDLLQDSQVLPGVVVILANYKGIFIVLFWFLTKSLKSLTHWPVFAPVILLVIANPKPSADLGGRVGWFVSVTERVKSSFFSLTAHKPIITSQQAQSPGPQALGGPGPKPLRALGPNPSSVGPDAVLATSTCCTN